MKPLDCPFVFVRWKDAVTQHGWIDENEAAEESGMEEVWSSGHMTSLTKSEVRLVSDVGIDGSRNRRIAIPLGMVIRIHRDNMTGSVLYERKVRAKKARKAAQGNPEPNSGE